MRLNTRNFPSLSTDVGGLSRLTKAPGFLRGKQRYFTTKLCAPNASFNMSLTHWGCFGSLVRQSNGWAYVVSEGVRYVHHSFTKRIIKRAYEDSLSEHAKPWNIGYSLAKIFKRSCGEFVAAFWRYHIHSFVFLDKKTLVYLIINGTEQSKPHSMIEALGRSQGYSGYSYAFQVLSTWWRYTIKDIRMWYLWKKG